MSDPFSVTASIAGVADLAVQVIQCLDDAKHGSKDRRALRAEISSLYTVLLAFQEVSELGNVQEQSNVNSTFLELPHGSLDQVRQTLERLVIKLSSATGGRGLRKVLPWHFEKAEVKCISDSIKRQRSLIELASLKQQCYIKAASFSDIKAVVEDMGKEIVLLKDQLPLASDLLLQFGSNLESRNKDGMTDLACAAKHGHVEIVGYLLEEGAKLEAIDGRGQTPLMWAAKRGYMNVVRLLLDNGANVNAHDNQNGTPYTWALKRGHNAIVDLLIQTNLVSVEPQDKWYDPKTFETLETSVQDWDTDVNERDRHGRTLLSRAAEFGHEASVLLLITNGADPEVDDGQGHTPLLWAAKRGHTSVVRLLLDHKACIEVKDSWFKKTSLSWAAKRGWVEVVQVLINHKADLAAADKYGQTALMWASKRGFVEIVDLLLKNGADITAKDIKAQDALMLAKLYKHDMVVRLLDAEHPGSDETFYALT